MKKKSTAEEAESAEVIFRKSFGSFGLPGSVGGEADFPHAS
jgi:hypothetical protein